MRASVAFNFSQPLISLFDYDFYRQEAILRTRAPWANKTERSRAPHSTCIKHKAGALHWPPLTKWFELWSVTGCLLRHKACLMNFSPL